jgi:hypothetical protein
MCDSCALRIAKRWISGCRKVIMGYITINVLYFILAIVLLQAD